MAPRRNPSGVQPSSTVTVAKRKRGSVDNEDSGPVRKTRSVSRLESKQHNKVAAGVSADTKSDTKEEKKNETNNVEHSANDSDSPLSSALSITSLEDNDGDNNKDLDPELGSDADLNFSFDSDSDSDSSGSKRVKMTVIPTEVVEAMRTSISTTERHNDILRHHNTELAMNKIIECETLTNDKTRLQEALDKERYIVALLHECCMEWVRLEKGWHAEKHVMEHNVRELANKVASLEQGIMATKARQLEMMNEAMRARIAVLEHELAQRNAAATRVESVYPEL